MISGVPAIDTQGLVRAWLLQESTVAALATFISAPDLPEGFDPDVAGQEEQTAVQVTIRGGSSHSEIPIEFPSVQIKVWALTGPDAWDLWLAIKNVMHGAQRVTVAGFGFVLSSLEEMPGQGLTDPDTGWATVVGAFRLTARAI
jgi:hypothetical protein